MAKQLIFGGLLLVVILSAADSAPAVSQRCYLKKTTTTVCTTTQGGDTECEIKEYYDWVCYPTGGGDGGGKDPGSITACYDCATKKIAFVWDARCCKGVECDFLASQGWIIRNIDMVTCSLRKIDVGLYDCIGTLCPQ